MSITVVLVIEISCFVREQLSTALVYGMLPGVCEVVLQVAHRVQLGAAVVAGEVAEHPCGEPVAIVLAYVSRCELSSP